jgi:hypothetical protein
VTHLRLDHPIGLTLLCEARKRRVPSVVKSDELTRRCPPDSDDRLASALGDAQVERERNHREISTDVWLRSIYAPLPDVRVSRKTGA